MRRLDDLLPAEHEARAVWDFVAALDLTAWERLVQAVEGRPGRSAIDARILLALWVYATLQGVGSARQLDRLCQEHHAYQWLRGGVGVNYHTLADFRSEHPELLDDLLTRVVAALRAEGLVSLRRVAQDGLRTRADAGAASFRRQATLQRCLQEAEAQVQALRAEAAADPAASQRRQQQARQRAARERQQRVARALAHLPEVAARKKPAQREQARASTTDPQAHVMKMADGGFRPAYNVQLATAAGSQVVVGVAVESSGSDMGQLLPMAEQLQRRYGEGPQEMLADGNFAKHTDIEALSGPEHNCTVYAPVPKPRDPAQDRHAPQAGEKAGVTAWRARMGTDQAKAIYRERAATAECVNAQARRCGLRQVRVRGVRKVLAAALLFALAHNVRRALALRAAAQGRVRAEQG